MELYDVTVVLGLKLDRGWKLPEDLKTRLDYAGSVYKAGQTKKIVMSGGWSIWFDWLSITPPITESALMKEYLTKRDIPSEAVLIEEKSRDTIGNIHFLKPIIAAHGYTKISVLCAKPHLKRVKFLCEQFLDNNITVAYTAFETPRFPEGTTGDETQMLSDQASVVQDLKIISEYNPRYNIYSHSYYTDQAAQAQKLYQTHNFNGLNSYDMPNVINRLLLETQAGSHKLNSSLKASS